MAPPPLVRRLVAEFIGTAMLLSAIVGSGIAAQRLNPHDVGLQLLENTMATAAAFGIDQLCQPGGHIRAHAD